MNMPRSGSESFQIYLQNHNEPLKPSLPAMDPSGTFQQTVPRSACMSPVPGSNFVESIAGIDSKLESLLGGSTRTILKSSAINSNATSFSDGPLVGSQEKSAFSVTTSAKLVEEHAQPILSDLSGEVSKIKPSENLAVVAENSVRSPVSNDDVGGVPVHSRKRKRILDTVETIENLYSEEKKLHAQLEEKLSVLHDMLNKQMDKPLREGKSLLPSFNGNSYAKHNKHNKKRKTSSQEKVVMQHACDSDERNKRDVVQTEVRGNANFYKQASLTGIDQKTTFGAMGEAIREFVKDDLEAMAGFQDLAVGDYMNLLNLDNAADEERYRLAMEMPLSPTLHEIEMQFADALNVDNTMPLANETLHEGLSNKEKELLPSHGFHTIDLESGFIKSKPDGSATSTNSVLHNNENHLHTLGILRNDWHASKVEKASGYLSSNFDQEVEMSNPTILRDEKSKFQFGGELGSSSKNIVEQCVVFSNIEDRSSISRMQYAIRTCIEQCSLATQTGWMMREILLALKKEEKLLAK